MSATYVLSALGVGACWTVPLLLIHRHYKRQDQRASNIVTFPRRDATVYELPRRGAS